MSGTTAANDLVLQAPVPGVIVALERVPDPVFSQRIAGPGIAIDPTDQTLVAPVDGKITQLHQSHHALTITTSSGAEVLLHVGLDTVRLRGEGFTALVKLGQGVRAGDELIRFDADLIGRKAKSLLTIMVVANGDGGAAPVILAQSPTHAGTPLVRFRNADLRFPASGAAATAGDWLKSDPIRVVADGGLHARPAAELASMGKKYKSELRIVKGTRNANLRSLSAVMSLEVGEGETISLEARGSDAKEALAALGRVLQAAAAAPPAPKKEAPAPAIERPKSAPGTLAGIMASPGCSAGKIFQLKSAEVQVKEAGEGLAKELPRLEAALEKARADLRALAKTSKEKKDTAASIFEAHLELVDDPELLDASRIAMEQGKSAEFAWNQAYQQTAAQLAALNNQLLAARANDVRDIGRRVARALSGTEEEKREFPHESILVAEDLTPSDVAGLDRDRVRGLCTTTGGATSHVAILARSLDLPALVGVDPGVLELANGSPVILDASHGVLRLNPTPEQLKELASLQERQAARKKEELARAFDPATTRDGHRLEIVANIKGAKEAKTSVELGGEGVGLLRTEFLFLNRNEAPSEEEQFESYSAIAKALGPERTLVIRTLDVGGDKPLPYLPLPKEENPFLGERGIRVSLRNLDSFRTQLRAILRVGSMAKVNIMFPMVAAVSELVRAKEILEEERKALGVKAIPAGVMIEVPSAALLAEHFAEHADFFSVGSNDLSQYTLAIDRGHPKLAAEVDGIDPSLLKLIDMTVRAAHAKKRWVGVCGGIAGDPQAVPLLIGLGVDELSVSVPAIPAIKAQVRNLSLKDCQELAQRALKLGSAAEVRALVPMND